MFSKNQVKLILFDIGGVLVDCGNSFQTVSKEQNFPIEYIDKTFDKYDREITTGKITPQELYLKCLKENNISADENYDFIDSWLKDYISIKPSFDLLTSLKPDYKVGFFSNQYKEMIPEMIIRGLLPNINYDYIFLSCDLGMQKPESNIYNYIVKATKLAANEILFIDDRDDYLETAVKSGWNTFKFLPKFPNESVNKLKELLF